MYKLILMARKKPGMSHEDFVQYYNNNHIAFMHSILDPGAAKHRRNFVLRNAESGAENEAKGAPRAADEFDVITEVFYENRETAEETMKAYADPDIRRRAQEDEERFLEPGSIRVYVVEAYETVFRPIDG